MRLDHYSHTGGGCLTPATPTARFGKTCEILARKTRKAFTGKTRVSVSALAWPKAPTPTGWTVLISGFLAVWITAQWGWVEAYLIVAICVVVLLLTLALIIWPTPHQIMIDLSKECIVVGQSAVGMTTVINMRNESVSSGVIKLPTGNGVGHFLVPPLGSRGKWDGMFSVTTR